uniref:Sporamin A n=2 Tax=Ipomoea TaxID=4119 RepID=Q15EK0_9ASTE|nr:sporamin A [Ipomoea x leucantha]ABG26226.1 sporamin A [Ipomoea x leucantha]ABG26228.1 sporamin A [Ipomoea x leucantha]ABG26233.1 sporamin A [Ipomoea trifida]
MKAFTLALFLALSLYLLPNPAHSRFNPIRLPTTHEPPSSQTPVLDINGDEVRAGGNYYMVSAIWGAGGGGLRLAHLDTMSKCASDVIVSPNDLDNGDPITITPAAADPESTVVMASTYQTFRFNIATNKLCVNNVNWGIQHDSASGQYFLKAGEFVSDNSNQFKIEVVDANLNFYKLTYCQFGSDKCYNVGRFHDPMLRTTRLALSNSPFVFVIKPTDV